MTIDRALRPLFVVMLVFSMSGCAGLRTSSVKGHISHSLSAEDNLPRTLFVFFDGTSNDERSQTNVYSLKLLIEKSKLSATLLYIEGVGALEDTRLLGNLFGVGMEERINAGYIFLSRQYRTGDRIVIVGFSRGAHQARALAGLISYAGLLDAYEAQGETAEKTVNRIIDATKDYEDGDVEEVFLKTPDEPPIRSALKDRLGVSLRSAPITFLGLWDTVPGSAFKNYGDCREGRDRRIGERYKTGSYPSVARIAHALALDEKRSRFRPILLCPPIRPDKTVIDEEWFAGAHADVGGGYATSLPALSQVSFAWMVKQLADALGQPLDTREPTREDFLAPAHWSIGDMPGNFGSDCLDRSPPAVARLHSSVEPRIEIGRAGVIVYGKQIVVPYPLRCISPNNKTSPVPVPGGQERP